MNNDENQIQMLISNIQSSPFVAYETSLLIEYIDALPQIMTNYRKQIFDEYIKYFENLYTVHTKALSSGTLIKRQVPKEKITKLFNFLFMDKTNKIKSIHQLVYCISGLDIIESYVYNKRTFDLQETEILMNATTNLEINEVLSKLFNNNVNAFEIDTRLTEYASFIPINKFVYRSINKKIEITQQCMYNIIKYSNDVKLCKKIVKYSPSLLNSECLNYSFKSKNKEIILFVLNNKIQPNENILKSIFNKKEANNISKNKTYQIDTERYISLGFEKDSYNSVETNYLMRTVPRNQYCTVYNMINVLKINMTSSKYKF